MFIFILFLSEKCIEQGHFQSLQQQRAICNLYSNIDKKLSKSIEVFLPWRHLNI